MTTEKEFGGWVTMGGGIALVIGAFLPWLKVTAPFIGTLERAGTDGGGDGWVAVAIGAVAVVVGVLMQTKGLSSWIAIAVGAVAALVMVYEFSDVHDRISSAPEMVSVDYGMGLFLCIAGAIAVTVGGVLGGRTRDDAPRFLDEEAARTSNYS